MPAVKESVLGRLATSLTGKGEAAPQPASLDIIDIRGNEVEVNLKDEVASLLDPLDGGARRLPTLLLYDAKGLQLFEQITYLDEYYLTNCEIELLSRSAVEIATKVPAGSMVIELGSGNLRKVCLLLQAFEDQAKPIDYYALDLSQKELERTLAHVPAFEHVACHGLLGTYDDGREWLKQLGVAARPKCIVHLGSSIGNFARDEAAEFLRDFADLLRPDTDSMIVAVDSCSDPDKIYHAYNDSQGITHQFILNGLAHANAIFGRPVFCLDDWTVVGEYVYDDDGGRHQAFVAPVRETTALGCVIRPYERVQIEQSLKYSRAGCERLWRQAGLCEEATWTTAGGEYGLHMLRRAPLPFAQTPALYADAPLPALRDWQAVWQAWDTLTTDMLPHQGLADRPIRLRNACIFYLGHIPTFLDLQLARATGAAPTEPAHYASIFERGIDPDVDNPEHCHDHSPVPDEWPPVAEIAAYQRRVRARLAALYHDGRDAIPRPVARAAWVGFEHELMHMETLLYMMLQSDKTLPPPHAPRPDFERMAAAARRARVLNQWFDVPGQTIFVGMDDAQDGHFGWDNEKPARSVTVHAFQAQGRPITNEEYAQYMYSSNVDQVPASWSCTDTPAVANGTANGHAAKAGSASAVPDSFLQNKSVRTVYGLVPLRHALDWPVFASYDELARCALWMGGRIPTLEEARSIYAYVESHRRELSTQSLLAKKVPAVNGHLVNDGVEETPPSGPSSSVEDSSSELFVDLAGANVGFRHWHPVPVTAHGDRLAGQAAMGGVWEWTSTPLQAHPGFQPMPEYPAYTADFFDGKHNVVLGGSWATHPRIAGRKSFVNWYQRNYPYAWAGARLVRDVQ